MTGYRHLELLGQGPVFVVRLLNRGLLDLYEREVEELAAEWTDVADRADCQTLWVDCSNVEVVSSGTLAKLIQLQRQLQHKGGRLVLGGIGKDLREVLTRTHLDQFFELGEVPPQQAAKREVCAAARGRTASRGRWEVVAAS